MEIPMSNPDNVIKIQPKAKITVNPGAEPAQTTIGITPKVGISPKATTSRIDISAIPGAAKGSGFGAMPEADDDIFKRRTTLLDTSSIPIAAAKAPAAQPRTVRISSNNRPTVRLNTPAGGASTFTPGEGSGDAPAAGGGRPVIKLKRPGGSSSVSLGGGETQESGGNLDFAGDEGLGFVVESEDSPGGVWAVLSILGVLVAIGLVVVQFMAKSAV